MIFGVVASAASTVGAIQTALNVLPPGTHNSGAKRIEVIKGVGTGLADVKDEYQKLNQAFHPTTPADLDFEKLAMSQQKYEEFLQQYRDIAGAQDLRELVERYFDL